MSGPYCALAPEIACEPGRGATAIVYSSESYPEAALKALVGRCRARGLSLAGVLQHPATEGADHRCDVLLEDLTSGYLTPLFENRGPARADAGSIRRRSRTPLPGSSGASRSAPISSCLTSSASSSAKAVGCAASSQVRSFAVFQS
jgi:hypothetical protein